MIDTIDRVRDRVLLIAYACSPDHGSEWANGWNRALASARRFDTWVICQGDGQQVEIERYLQKHGPIEGLHFIYLPVTGDAAPPVHPAGLKWVNYNLWHRRAFRKARELHTELGFQLVHQLTNTGFREPGYLWKLDAPFVWGPIGGTHNYPWRFLREAGLWHGSKETVRSFFNYWQLNWSRRPQIASRRATAMLVSNTTMEEQVRKAHGVSPETILDVGVADFANVERPKRESGQPLRIVWSGQFVSRKALSLLLKALAAIKEDVNFELRVVGGGPMEARWKRMAERLQLTDRIEWLGWVPHSESLQQYAWADVFAFTSLRDNSGTVILEALANGLPVICLSHQGAQDIVTEQCGYRVPVTTPNQVVRDLAAALRHMAAHDDLHEQMSRAAFERARDYTWSALGDRMVELYQDLLEDGGAARKNGHTKNGHASNGHSSNGHSNNGHALNGSSQNGASQNGHAPVAVGGSEPQGDEDAFCAAVIPRNRVREAITWAAQRVAVGMHKVGGDRFNGGFGILMYHRVADRVPGVVSPTNNVAPKLMRKQLEGLLERGFEPWPLSRALEAYRENRPIPPKAFVVTFDDGYENNLVKALPILRDLKIPATIFLATAFLDSTQPFPCDDWTAAGDPRVPINSWRPLTTAQCHELLESGLIELGAHTHTHQFFLGRTNLFRRDLGRSIEILEEKFGIRNPSFAFPFGMMDDELIAVTREAGLSCALSTRSERVKSGSPPFTWGRFSADDNDSVATLAAKLGGWYTTVGGAIRSVKKPVENATKRLLKRMAQTGTFQGAAAAGRD